MNVRQVAGPDTAFLYGERPEWHFHVSALMIVDPTDSDRFSLEEITAQLIRRIDKVPQFRWKLVEGPLGLRLERPIWVDDPEFDVQRHVGRVGVPSPGDDRALGELVGRLVSFKLDRTRPLWEMWIIEGLADGRVALLAKVHHSIIDGESGTELATLLFDLEPDPEPDQDPPPWVPEPQPSSIERLGLSAGNAMMWPIRAGRVARQLARQGIVMGRHALGSEPPAQPLRAPRTPLNGTLTPERSFASAKVPIDEVKRVKNAFGVKLNDVVLAISSGALRRYLIELDALPEQPLIAQVPVSIRDDDSKDHVGTKVAAMFCSLATDVGDPTERLRAIHLSTTSGKDMRQELSSHHEVNLTDTTPPALIAMASRTWGLAGLDGRTPPIFNLIISNVPGPPFDLYLAGARIEAMFPMGPLLYGSGVNFTAVSSPERLDFGLMACPALVPDPWAIADKVQPALDELSTAAGL
ncbi:MAG: wax ester/triacylglycerol synthase family O-acyltransferase [Acidimicrobiia bacterium]|nr:wax ester/triacylglycerol synthase family O-acyltransferase [Acidimicrobiia bacterium]